MCIRDSVLSFTLRNTGTTPIPLNTVQAEAVDRSGLRYPSMVAAAKKYGRVKTTLTDAAARELEAGGEAALSAAYMVPVTLTESLTFVVTGPSGDRALFDLTPSSLEPPPTPTPTPTPTPSPNPTAAPTETAAPSPTPAAVVEVSAAVIIDRVPGVTPTNGLFLSVSLTAANPADVPVQIGWADFVLVCAEEGPECAGAAYPPADLYEVDGRLVNALPITIPARSRVELVLVFDASDVPAVRLTACGQEFLIRLR